MPELPEVETVVRQLRAPLVGRTLTGVRVSWPATVARPSPAAFRRGALGRRVTGRSRRGKYFVIELDGDPVGGAAEGPLAERRPDRLLVGHLRMTGRMSVEDDPEPPFTRASFALDDGRHLVFRDVRKFGRLALVRRLDEILPPLGPEPLGGHGFPELDADWLAAALRSRRRQLKPLLLDQSFLAGLGNIYVDESLHRARLHPLRSSDRVGRDGAARLATAIRQVLTEAIAKQGSSFDAFYRTPEGRPGDYQHEFRVYGRTGQPCPRCGAAIRRMVVGQRGTHYCGRCQRAPRTRTPA